MKISIFCIMLEVNQQHGFTSQKQANSHSTGKQNPSFQWNPMDVYGCLHEPPFFFIGFTVPLGPGL
jgi:hypothetical protein